VAGEDGLSGPESHIPNALVMQRAAAIIGSAIFLVIAPGTLAVYVPWYLTHWHVAPPLFPIARGRVFRRRPSFQRPIHRKR
jgi:hypothetical protein